MTAEEIQEIDDKLVNKFKSLAEDTPSAEVPKPNDYQSSLISSVIVKAGQTFENSEQFMNSH